MGSNPASPTNPAGPGGSRRPSGPGPWFPPNVIASPGRLNDRMCGRFVGNFAIRDVVAELAGAGGLPGVLVEDGVTESVANFNTAPTAVWPVVIDGADGARVRMARWGLVPGWSRDPSVGAKMINARSETLTEKPSFRNLVKGHRALVPVDGFYEWERSDPKNKRPYFVPRADGRLMWVAGLWTVSPVLDGATTFTMITRASLSDLSMIHDRSPVQLRVEDAVDWLTAPEPPLGLLSLVDPPELAPHEVDRRVNSVRNNSPDLVDPVQPDTLF